MPAESVPAGSHGVWCSREYALQQKTSFPRSHQMTFPDRCKPEQVETNGESGSC